MLNAIARKSGLSGFAHPLEEVCKTWQADF